MQWTLQQSNSGVVNTLTAPVVDPVSGQPALKSGNVTARKFNAKWYAFAASLYEMRSADDYGARARTHAISAIGSETPALHSLAGRDPKGQSNPGPTICACMNVGINTVRDAVSSGAYSIDDIGKVTGAGTSCGSCKPELTTILEQAKTLSAAE